MHAQKMGVSSALTTFFLFVSNVRKTARIKNRYNQVPHLSQNTKWESNKITINTTNKSQKATPFPLDDHKAVTNRRQSMTNKRHKNINDPQKKHRLGTVSNSILLEGLNPVYN